MSLADPYLVTLCVLAMLIYATPFVLEVNAGERPDALTVAFLFFAVFALVVLVVHVTRRVLR